MQLLSSIFEKERQGANRSRRSLKKINCEQIDPLVFKKEWQDLFCCDSSKSLSKNEQFAQKNVFYVCFW